jgi:hypothetical protein
MASEKHIPEEVLRFIEQYIDDVPQLETLLMMRESPDRTWLVEDVAAHNYISPQRAQQTLDGLRRRGLVSADESGFRLDASAPGLRTLIDEVARVYKSNLSRIATLIHSRPSASIKEFARAFDLKKDR